MIARPMRLLAAAAALCLAAPASAAELAAAFDDVLDQPPVLQKRLVEVHPYAGVSESYDSNIFLHKDKTASWITAQNAGLRVPGESGNGRHKLELDYDAAHRDYSYSHQGALRNAFVQAADARYWYKSPAGVTARAKELYLNTIDPANSEQSGLRRRWQNTVGAWAGYEPDDRPFHLGLDAEESRYKYVSSVPTLDRYEQLLGGRAGWQVQPKTVAYAAYHRQIIHATNHPDPSRDSSGDLLDFGVEGQLLPLTTGRAQVGLVHRRYDAAPAPGQDRETRNFTYLLALDYRPDDRTKLELSGRRSLQQSEFDINQFYIATAVAARYAHELPWSLMLTLNGGTEWDKYPTTTVIAGSAPVNQFTHVYQAGAGLEYPFLDWLHGQFDYSYRARFARALTDTFDYVDHITAVALTATF